MGGKGKPTHMHIQTLKATNYNEIIPRCFSEWVVFMPNFITLSPTHTLSSVKLLGNSCTDFPFDEQNPLQSSMLKFPNKNRPLVKKSTQKVSADYKKLKWVIKMETAIWPLPCTLISLSVQSIT